MKTKVLHTKSDPIISCYNYYGSLMSMIEDDANIWPWFYSNFTQLAYCPTGNWYFFENGNDQSLFENCPWLNRYSLSQKMIMNKWKSFKNFVVYCIDNDFYCLINVDRYYLPFVKAEYLRYHFAHELFIYGYDLEKDIAYVADNVGNYNLQFGKYVQAECAFSDLEQAFHGLPEQDSSNFCYEKIESGYHFFNAHYFKKSLECFLLGLTSLKGPIRHEGRIYGLEVYDQMILTLRMIKRGEHPPDFRAFHPHFANLAENEKNLLDIRPYQLMVEHKKCMTKRLKFMIEHAYIRRREAYLQSYETMEKQFVLIRNIAVKYNLTQNTSLLDTLAEELETNKKTEKETIQGLLENLQFKPVYYTRKEVDNIAIL